MVNVILQPIHSVSYGYTVKIRFGNIQMHHHPIHLHGHEFKVIGADGFPIKDLLKYIYKYYFSCFK